MGYKSIAPQLKTSCYNCLHFEVSDDMLNGTCYFNIHHKGKAAIGIGTCESFAARAHQKFDFASAMKKKALVSSPSM